MTEKIFLIGNPIAGGGALKKIKNSFSILKEKGFDVHLMLTSQKGDAESFARQISQQSGLKSSLLVIAAGGDGTYNEVANGLAFSNIPMAILPLGTTSVLAKELKIPSNIERALNIALNGKTQKIHLGRITSMQGNGQRSEVRTLMRYFLLMAGIGFDGEAVLGLNEKMKRYIGKGSYILSGIKTLIKYNPSLITLRWHDTANGAEISNAGYVAIIGKGSCYGGNFKITPDAKLTEPWFYVFLAHKKRRFDLIRYAAGIISRSHLNFKDISYFKASDIEIQGDAHIQIDGDYFGSLPAKIDVATDALKLVIKD